MVLGPASDGRDNNLNLIRLLAALAVLFSHAWPIARGPDALPPVAALWGTSLATMAVTVFFVLSGFLIAGSWARRPDAAAFLAARIARLFPALAVVVLLTAFGLGPVMTDMPLADYVTDPATWTYPLRNLSLAFLQYPLPGVLMDAPYPGAVNGSLWTLVHEVACYGAVLALGLLGLVGDRRRLTVALTVFAILYALGALVAPALPQKLAALRLLAFPFALGMAAWAWRDRIVLRWDVGAAFLALAWFLRGSPLAAETLALALGYGAALLAFRPGGAIRGWNRLGDYSYGVYIIAFPVQQALLHWAGPMTPLDNAAVAALITLPLAVICWHAIERPALARKDRLAAAFRAAAASPRPSPPRPPFRSEPPRR
ncbi:acyltransferase family protein [Jannaschia ovalis]|uniref:Acyltransferase n=1 Tax=Jannaschia ovalis TaxID=3038773 RepID=A0ABY8L9I7_9RHOB|nr:acyltransferase [Jannaschia sp. GRR-S6-38]WGH78025.1 acyltransferase [Jannaschia sp. GRR-S6-38]